MTWRRRCLPRRPCRRYRLSGSSCSRPADGAPQHWDTVGHAQRIDATTGFHREQQQQEALLPQQFLQLQQQERIDPEGNKPLGATPAAPAAAAAAAAAVGWDAAVVAVYGGGGVAVAAAAVENSAELRQLTAVIE